MDNRFIFLAIPIFITLLVIHISDVQAITITTTSTNGVYISKSPLIGIQLSPTCLMLIKNHMNTNCPTYDKLEFMDNTNPQWAGKWINDTYYHRELPRLKNHYIMNLNPIVVMVDPDPDYTTISKMIIIQADNFTYINPGEGIGNNHTRNEYQNRFVGNCEVATVAPIIPLINDTLHYLESDCKTTKYTDKVIIQTGNKPFDYSNPYSSLHHQAMLKQYGITIAGESHLMGGHTIKFGDCIHKKCNFIDPYKKPNWGH